MADGSIGLWTVPLAVLGGAIRVSTPFLFVSLGECITERSGRINLGLEGTLVMGAMSAYGISYLTGSPWLGVFASYMLCTAAACSSSPLFCQWAWLSSRTTASVCRRAFASLYS